MPTGTSSVVSVSALCTVHHLDDSRRLGWAFRRAIEDRYDGSGGVLRERSLSTASRRTARLTPTATGSGAPSEPRPRRRRLWQRGDWKTFMRHAARVRGQGPRRGLHARHRDAARRARLNRYDRGVEVITPFFPVRAPGRSTRCSGARRMPDLRASAIVAGVAGGRPEPARRSHDAVPGSFYTPTSTPRPT